MEPWAAPKKLLVSVEAPPAPVRVPSQRPLTPSVPPITSVTNNKGDNQHSEIYILQLNISRIHDVAGTILGSMC